MASAPLLMSLSSDRINNRIDRLPMTSWHWAVFFICVVVLVFDQTDNNIVNSVFPILIKEWGITKFDIGVILAFGNGGAVLGAFVFGRLADRYGRRRVFIWAIVWFSILTGLVAFSQNMYHMMVLKALAGLGLGGAAPLSALILGEFSPAKWRGRLLAWWTASFAGGSLLAGLIGLYVVVPYGWRWGVAACSLTIISALVVRFFLPESPRYLVQQGRLDEAIEAVEQVEKNALGRVRAETIRKEEAIAANDITAMAAAAAPGSAEPVPTAREALRMMLAPGMLGVTISAMAVWILPTLFSLGQFYVVILTEDRGLPLSEAIALVTASAVFAPAGTFIAGFLSDLFGRKIACPIFALIGGIGPLVAFTLAPVDDPALFRTFVIVGLGLATAGISGMFGVMWGYTQESFPTKIRATALGLGNSFWRLSAVLGPLIIGAIYETGGVQIAVFSGLACVVVASALFLIYGRETKGKGLAGDDAEAVPSSPSRGNNVGEPSPTSVQ